MMIAADGYYYTFTGREGEVIPRHVTRVRIDESLTDIPARAFDGNPSIEELECHVDVKTVGGWAFAKCPSLRRVIMRGVEEVERGAFYECNALAIVGCDKLERIGGHAFSRCISLRSINLPSAKIVEGWAFSECTDLTNVEFGKELEIIRVGAFDGCTSLERITIPLKDDIITENSIFQGCKNLKQVVLVEGELHENTSALLLEEWKNDMNEEIYSINQILPTLYDDDDDDDFYDVGGKARAIQRWIRAVLHKIIHYKAQHQHVLEEATTTLKLALPQDIVIKNVLPFLELPSHTFELGDHEDEEDDSDNEDDVDDFDDDESSY